MALNHKTKKQSQEYKVRKCSFVFTIRIWSLRKVTLFFFPSQSVYFGEKKSFMMQNFNCFLLKKCFEYSHFPVLCQFLLTRKVNQLFVVVLLLSHVQPFWGFTWTVACQAPLAMGFPRREYWNGLLFPPPGDLLD